MTTIRQQITDLLMRQQLTPKEISKAVRIREKEVYDHLDHIARSVEAKQMKFSITTPRCLKCDYVFKNRTRYTRPSRCPVCKGTWIEDPVYKIVPIR